MAPTPGRTLTAHSPEAAGRKAVQLTQLCTIRPLPPSVICELDPVLTELLQRAEAGVRAQAAARLARCDWAPREAVRLLAFEPLDIARPVIERSMVLDETDLIALADLSHAHRMALIARIHLSAPVTLAMARHRERDCLMALANHEGALISEASAGDFAAIARAHESLQEALAGRGDLSEGFVRALHAVAASHVRARLAGQYPDLADLAFPADKGAGFEIDPDVDRHAETVASQLQSDRALSTSDVLRAARNGRAEIADHAIARLTGIEAADWRQALRRSPLRACLLAARAMAMAPGQAADLYSAMAASGRAHAMEPDSLTRACADIYAAFSRDDARRALHRMGAGGSIH
ncbi:DUF2336 domain-containing protein [Alkalicaulis satelles]|nr:DUF2336 domain-containing protein [Alkalicaulis satelles]